MSKTIDLTSKENNLQFVFCWIDASQCGRPTPLGKRAACLLPASCGDIQWNSEDCPTVSLYTPARAVHSTSDSSSVRWSCWHGLGESQRRVSTVQVQCNQRINNRPLNPTDPTDCRDSLRYKWFTPTSHELSSSIFIGPRSDHSLPMSLTHWLTHWRPCWRLNELT